MIASGEQWRTSYTYTDINPFIFIRLNTCISSDFPLIIISIDFITPFSLSEKEPEPPKIVKLGTEHSWRLTHTVLKTPHSFIGGPHCILKNRTVCRKKIESLSNCVILCRFSWCSLNHTSKESNDLVQSQWLINTCNKESSSLVIS